VNTTRLLFTIPPAFTSFPAFFGGGHSACQWITSLLLGNRYSGVEKRRPLFYKQTTLQRNKRTLLEANSALKIIIFHLAAFFIHCIFIYIFFIFDFFRDANCASVRTGNYALAYVNPWLLLWRTFVSLSLYRDRPSVCSGSKTSSRIRTDHSKILGNALLQRCFGVHTELYQQRSAEKCRNKIRLLGTLTRINVTYEHEE